MKDGFKVFDGDMRVLEPPDLWERYIDPAFRDRPPRESAESPMDLLGVLVDGNSAFQLAGQIARVSYDTKYPDATARFLTLGFDAASTRKMDTCARLYGFGAC